MAPFEVIEGATTQLCRPDGLAVDSAGDLWVADGEGRILEFAPGAHGDVAPIRDITGSNTTFDYPTDVKIGSDGEIYVVDNDHFSVDVFPKNSTGNVAPSRTIAGSNTGFTAYAPYSIALQSDGTIVIGSRYNAIQT